MLLPFNSADKVTVGELCEITKMPINEVSKVLRSIIDAKLLQVVGEQTAALTKDTASEEAFSTSAVIRYNSQFSSKRTRIKLLAAAGGSGGAAEAPQEQQAIKKQMDVDRQLFLQALVVRLMKTHKSMSHNRLIESVISESRSRYVPPIADIKKCIESLLEKQYLERDRNSKDTYIYVA